MAQSDTDDAMSISSISTVASTTIYRRRRRNLGRHIPVVRGSSIDGKANPKGSRKRNRLDNGKPTKVKKKINVKWVWV